MPQGLCEVRTQISHFGNLYYKLYVFCVTTMFPLVLYLAFACGTQGAYEVNKNIKQMVTFPAIIFSPEVCDYFAWGRLIVPD